MLFPIKSLADGRFVWADGPQMCWSYSRRPSPAMLRQEAEALRRDGSGDEVACILDEAPEELVRVN